MAEPVKVHRAIRCLAAALLLLAAGLASGQTGPYRLDAKAMLGGRVLDLPRTWSFRPTPAGQPASMDPILWPDQVPPQWKGEGWFELPIEVPSSLVGSALALKINAPGVAVVQLDGRPMATRGGLAAGWDRDSLIPLRFDRDGVHELRIHYTNALSGKLLRAGRPAGFTVVVGRAEAVHQWNGAASRRAAFMVWFFTTVFLAFGLLHFCLWLFQRHAVGNLWFAGLCLANASLVFFLFYKDLTTNQRFMLISEPVMNVSGLLFGLFAIRFVYGVFPWRFARPVFRALIAIAAVIAVWSVIHTWNALPFVFAFMLLSCVEVVRVVIAALWRKRSGARLIGFGVLALGLGFGIALLRNLGLLSAVYTPGGNVIPFASMVVLIGSMSLYLSREFARTDRELRRQLVEVARLSEEKLEHERRAQREETERRLLEAEYRRKSEELEEARALQMSMLPREIPLHERLEIAAWISTASEVGGDYYDFITEGGVLLLGIGDATGHGMRAGTMVTAAKALFGALDRQDPARQMEESNRALRRMNLRRLAMAFTLAQFRDTRVRLSSAGMPPVYLRRATGLVETIELPGSPLGSLARFPYQQIEVSLYGGDFIVFMSDGLPELQSEGGEMVGYERLTGLLRGSTAASAQELVTELAGFAARWKGSRAQDDDITFVVVRMKEHEIAM
jgi:serine phosphatase RsbU (regulator of sigma subunit)